MRNTRTQNKPIAYMAADVIIQASVLRINISYYPQSSLLETATNAIAKTLGAIPLFTEQMVSYANGVILSREVSIFEDE